MSSEQVPAQRPESSPAETGKVQLPAAAATPTKRTLLRIVLMVVVPGLLVIGGLTWYYAGGRYVTSENAYVKAPIISVVSQVSGRISSVHVQENQPVKKGQVLIELDGEEFALAVTEAEADVAAVGQEIENLRSELRRARAEIEIAKERRRFLDDEHKRNKDLAAQGLGLGTKLAESQHLLRAAGNNLLAAREREAGILASLNGNPDAPLESHPKYKAALARLDRARLNHQRTRLVSSTDGYVIKMSWQEGEFVEQGEAAFAIVDTAKAFIEANLKETELTHVKRGQKATFTAEAYPDVTWVAEVSGISPATGAEFAVLPPQNASGNWVKVVQRLPVRLAIDPASSEAKPALRSGLSVTVSIDTGHQRQAPPIISQVLAATRNIVAKPPEE